MSNKLYVGIDVGKNGGIAAIYPSGHIYQEKVETAITPLIGKGKGSEIDIQSLRTILQGYEDYAEKDLTVVIEDVHSIFGVSAGSNFQFGRALGILEGLVAGMKIAYIKVSPKTWQGTCFEGVPVIEKPGTKAKGRSRYDSKAMALIAAKRLYPTVSLTKPNSKAVNAHDGIVDALLMAHHAKICY